jgi:PTH1 family peptidyl-tRNA hydrolase
VTSSSHPYLFVGLGNPGSRYAMTRHNIGFMVIETLAQQMSVTMQMDKRFEASIGKKIVGERQIHLMMPMTYMNLSGTSVRRYIDYFKLTADAVVVVADDVNLEFGQQRLKAYGSAGGHNGLKSVQNSLGTQDYRRLRLGVGSPQYTSEGALSDYVLAPFSGEEREQLPTFVAQGAATLHRLITEDFHKIVNDVNTKIKKINPDKGQEKMNGQNQT